MAIQSPSGEGEIRVNQQELKTILDSHRKWVLGDLEGTRANLRGADLTDANLTGAYLTGAELTDAYLTGADLRGADLTDANLTGAYLTDAYLTDAYLRGADLTCADLRDAYLRGADLTGANLRGADLTDANLTGAYLTGAYLTGAYLTGANLTRAKIDPIKEDFFEVLKLAKAETPALYQAIVDGKINGSAYQGECACLVGTIAKARHIHYRELGDLKPNGERPAERWFLAIRQGDTPENNPVSAIVKDWCEEFMKANEIVVPVREVVWR